MEEEYERNLRGFFATSPTPEFFREILEKEDLTVNLRSREVFSRAALLYLLLAKTPDARFMDVFLSFRPDVLEYVSRADCGVNYWIKTGRNEYFTSLFRYYTMEELRRIIDANIEEIIKSGDIEIFDLLTKNGYLNADNVSNLLKLAIKHTNISVVDFLLNKEVKVEPIHFIEAIMTQRIDMLQRMMMYGGNVNLADSKGTTPLSVALATNNIDVIREILSYGVDVNAGIVWHQYSALMLVIENYSLRPLIKDFISAGANVNFRTLKGETPLSIAGDNEEIRALLVAAGATDEGSGEKVLYSQYVRPSSPE